MMTHVTQVSEILRRDRLTYPSMSQIRSFKDLIVWQRAMQLSRACFFIVERAPRGVTRGIAAQLLEASNSVSANIAEGKGRPSRREYLRFLSVAHASLREVESHLLTLEYSRGLRMPAVSHALHLCDECSRMLTVLQRRLQE